MYNITLQKNIAELAEKLGLSDPTAESLAALGSGSVRASFTGSGPNEFADFRSFSLFYRFTGLHRQATTANSSPIAHCVSPLTTVAA